MGYELKDQRSEANSSSKGFIKQNAMNCKERIPCSF